MFKSSFFEHIYLHLSQNPQPFAITTPWINSLGFYICNNKIRLPGRLNKIIRFTGCEAHAKHRRADLVIIPPPDGFFSLVIDKLRI